MKKLIASLLTVATVASMASFSAFAAAATKAVVKVDLTGITVTTDTTTTSVSIKGTAYSYTSGTGDTIDAAGAAIAGKDDANYTVDYDVDSDVLTFTAATAGKSTLAASDVTFANLTGTPAVSVTNGADVSGEDAIKAITPIDTTAYVENAEDASAGDAVKTDKSVYYIVSAPFNNTDNFELTPSKGDDAKAVKKISIVEKSWSKVYTLAGAEKALTVKNQNDRVTLVKVELAENYTDKEFHISFDLKVKADKTQGGFTKGDSYKFEDVAKVYVKNTKDTTDDVTYSAGTSGVVVKPEKNEENTVEWEDNNDTIATLKFEADSDVDAYYPKLSTKWVDADYAENFSDTDAFFRSFIGNPTISSTSRPTLTLVSPFVDEDGEETVAVEDIVIYELVDGALVDSTAKFTAGEDDDGNTVFTIKTRTLGTYIFSNGAATAAEEAPTEEAPTDVKANPGTGRF